MKQTTNYKFNKPELTDLPDITQLNQNFDTIDAELKAHDTEIEALDAALDGKAASSHSHTIGQLPRASVAEAKAGSIDTKVMTPAKAKESALVFGMSTKSTNPITSTANDTPVKWKEVGAGTYYFNKDGYLINQPSAFGFLINYVFGDDVFQLWKNQASGDLCYRSGNASGWGEQWAKCVIEDDLSELVHKTGSESIGGEKTFTSNITMSRNEPQLLMKQLDVDRTIVPSSDQFTRIRFVDKNYVNMGALINQQATSGKTYTYITAYNKDNKQATISAVIADDGTSYATAPTTPSGSTDNRIVTADYLNGTNSGVVHKSGAEIIHGNKTFTGDMSLKEPTPVLKMIRTDMELGGNFVPTSAQSSYISFLDKNEKIQATIYGGYSTSGNSLFGIQAYDPLLGGTSALFQLIFTKEGQKYAIAPTTPKDSTGAQIVTADYLNSTGTYAPGNLPYYEGGNTIEVTDFNALKTPGRYHVRYTNTAVNVPMTVNSVTDGILEVDRIGSGGTASGSARIRQKFHPFGGLGNYQRTFFRIYTVSSNTWKDWVENITSMGGKLTGGLNLNDVGILNHHKDATYEFASLYAIGDNAPGIELFTNTSATNASGFNVRARGVKGEYYDLAGRNDGSLQWGGKDVVCVTSWHKDANWYRIYSDGWIEQGGVTATTGSNRTISLHTAFTDTNYTVITTAIRTSAAQTWPATINKTSASGFTMYCTDSGAVGADFMWYACGY